MSKAIETLNGKIEINQHDLANYVISGTETPVTVQDLVNALCNVLDGYSDHDIVGMTGFSLDQARQINNIRLAVKSAWEV